MSNCMLNREHEQHLKKMGKIGATSIARSEAKMVANQLKKNRDERKKTKEFLTNERNITINKDN